MNEKAVRVNERTRLATALRSLATQTVQHAGRLPATVRNLEKAERGIRESITMRDIAGLIEEGKL